MLDPFDNHVPFITGGDAEPWAECHCGEGYCQAHGTFHFDPQTEYDELQRRQCQAHGTGGGTRVIKKKLGGE